MSSTVYKCTHLWWKGCRWKENWRFVMLKETKLYLFYWLYYRVHFSIWQHVKWIWQEIRSKYCNYLHVLSSLLPFLLLVKDIFFSFILFVFWTYGSPLSLIFNMKVGKPETWHELLNTGDLWSANVVVILTLAYGNPFSQPFKMYWTGIN